MHNPRTSPPPPPPRTKPAAKGALAPPQELNSTRLAGCSYVLLESVSAGSMGSVHRARQLPQQREVAIKILHPHLAKRSSVAAAFWREAQAGRLIKHPNVVQILDFGRDPHSDCAFMVMELLGGRTLEDLLRERRVPEVRWTAEIMTQILTALAAAHDLGIVHRDIKPENVIVDSGQDAGGKPVDVVKVCDFGIARVPFAGPASSARKDSTLEGTVCGTPEYMSPEQAQARSVDRMTDIYACGVMLYEMVTGRLPFEAESAIQIVLQHIHSRPRRPRKLRPELDPRLEAIILRAMAKDPRERFTGARAMRAALLQWLEATQHEATSLAQQPTTPQRPLSDDQAAALAPAPRTRLDSAFALLLRARARRARWTTAVVLGSLALVALAGAVLAR